MHKIIILQGRKETLPFYTKIIKQHKYMNESVNIRELNDLIASKSNFVNMITQGMNQTIVGQKHLIDSLLISLLANGHILLEGVPGLAKTLAIKTLSTKL